MSVDLYGLDDESRLKQERSILDITEEYLKKMNSSRRCPSSVQWLPENFDAAMPVFLWRKNRLGLRREMQGKLSLDEWRPLLASSVVLNTRMRRKRDSLIATMFLSTTSSLVLLFAVLQTWVFPYLGRTFFIGSAGGIGVFLFGLFLGLLFIFASLTKPYRRKLVYRADEIVVRELGQGSELLAVLKKIQKISLDQPDRFASSLRDTAIPGRIANLSAILGQYLS